MRLAWLTDPHLNFVPPEELEAFYATLAATEADAFLLSGDIAEAPDVAVHLNGLETALARPIFFVLGNHDFYRGSIAAVRAKVAGLCEAVPNLVWLTNAGVVPLTDTAGLVGHDGWGDARLGDPEGSRVFLNDWVFIEDLKGLPQAKLLPKLHARGDEAAAHFRSVLPEALERFHHVIVVTHVPPFREACWHEGKLSADDWLPHFSCKAVGEVLREAMERRPEKTMTVLCEHTHGAGEAEILPNLHVSTGGARYGKPALQRMLEV